MKRLLLSISLGLLAGCITQVAPPADHAQMRIHWARSFSQAEAIAQAEHKPIYLVLAAGKLDGPC